MIKPRLIVLEGFDRTGKDTLMNMIQSDVSLSTLFVCYQQPTIEDENVDYKNPEEFKKFMLKHTRLLLDNLYNISKDNPGKSVVVSRMFITDNVFSDMFHREHVLDKYFKDELLDFFEVNNYIMFFKDYNEYVLRCKLIGEYPDFSKNEYEQIYSLFKKYSDSTSKFKYILSQTTPDEVLNDFLITFFNKH